MRPTDPSSTPDLRETVSLLERCLDNVKAALGIAPGSLAHGAPERAVIKEQQVRRLLAARRLRELHLGAHLFADPAWDLLLEAFASELARSRRSPSDLCDCVPVPRSTALRWLAKLEEDGWLRPQPDTGNGALVELTADGSARLRHFFESAGTFALSG